MSRCRCCCRRESAGREDEAHERRAAFVRSSAHGHGSYHELPAGTKRLGELSDGQEIGGLILQEQHGSEEHEEHERTVRRKALISEGPPLEEGHILLRADLPDASEEEKAEAEDMVRIHRRRLMTAGPSGGGSVRAMRVDSEPEAEAGAEPVA